MKLYLSSYRVPVITELETLVGVTMDEMKIAIIPNAKDYYADRAWKYKVSSYVTYFEAFGSSVSVVDLRTLRDAIAVTEQFAEYDLLWVTGGNTFCLRYEMRRSGFDVALLELLDKGVVYGGDSAGALVAGQQIGGLGIEQADTPEFAEAVIAEGLDLIPNIILPHADDPNFTAITVAARSKFEHVIELKNSEALVVDGGSKRIVSAAPAKI